MNLHIHNRVAGRYRIKTLSGDKVTQDTGWFDNLIVNNGLDQLANVAGGSFSIPFLFTQAYVGTGTTPPAVTDTQLESYLASSSINESATNSFVEAVGTTPAYWRCVRVLTFGAGVATGTLSEVAVGKTSTNIFSRALIVDGSGNPTTITVLSTETLQVTYEYRNYLDKTDHTTTVDISGVTYNVTYRLCKISSPPQIDRGIGHGGDNSNCMIAYSGSIGTVYSSPVGSSVGSGTFFAINTYSPGNYYADMSKTYQLSEANFGGILSIQFFGNQYSYQAQFSPAIPKNSTNVLTMNMRVSWGRYTP